MKLQFNAERATADQWRRVAELRLRALTDSPEWFAGWQKRGEPLPSRSKPGQMYQIMVRELPS